ncbi:hypothetical protein QTI17_17340 [Variovorax sp. J31P179]|uniref:hypothetical protein n=1 Tax=Variovorax sp. J31P179 TaxID=3053508 RepID=UPI0025769CB1|nr:hypothetical protein [Variovorax sp. J31P179]MDM0082359.1 hypothetical protein [Variovorax sp. J31P179]
MRRRRSRKRLKRCGISAKIQPWLFDGVAIVDPEFEPRRTRRISVRRLVEAAIHQRTWNFG